MLLVIAFCSTWLLSFITSNDDIDKNQGRGCSVNSHTCLKNSSATLKKLMNSTANLAYKNDICGCRIFEF